MRGKLNCSTCTRWRPVTDFQATQFLWGHLVRLSAQCETCRVGNCYNLVPSRLILASQPEEPKKTQKRYPLAPKPLKSLKPKIIPKATAYSDKNRRHDETDEQFKGRERERKRQLRREGRG